MGEWVVLFSEQPAMRRGARKLMQPGGRGKQKQSRWAELSVSAFLILYDWLANVHSNSHSGSNVAENMHINIFYILIRYDYYYSFVYA